MYNLNKYFKIKFKRGVWMKKLTNKTARFVILAITLLLVVGSAILIFSVKTNYDLTEYLPNDSQTVEGLEVIENTFGNYAQVELMIENKDVNQTINIKEDLEEVDGVIDVVWLDDYADVYDLSSVDPQLLFAFYNNNNPLLTIVFDEDAYALSVEESIDEIRGVLKDESVYLRGNVIDNIESRNISENETLKIIIIIVPVAILILIFASHSWLEPLVVLVVLGVGVLLNLGTNAFLPSVSFITLTIAAALQLAISLDYSLFYIHRYYEFKDEGYSAKIAVHKAFKKSLPVVSASAITTMIGFVALFFMRYKIGLDIGIVLTKGIIFSYLSVIFLLPVILIIADPLLEKLKHKHFMFNLGAFKKVFYKFRYLFLILFVGILTFGIISQSQTTYIFGNSDYAGNDSQIALDKEAIEEYYPEYESITLLLKDSSKEKELNIINNLASHSDIINIDALYLAVPANTPENMIPVGIKGQYQQDFQGDTYSRITIFTSITEESQAMFDLNDDINDIVDGEYESFYSLGTIPSTDEIRTTVLQDTPIVIGLSIGLIFIVLLFVFKNVLMSFLLIAVIQGAIWMNMGMLALTDRSVVYIGYLVVLALQLGATIDYAVLFASRYKEYREKYSIINAIGHSLKKASVPIMISGFVLAAAGFAEMLFSDLQVVSDIGLLIGRGAILSLGFVLFILPSLLAIFDKWLIKKENRFQEADR